MYTNKGHKEALQEVTGPLNEQITTLTGERDTAVQAQADLESQNATLTSERDALQAQIDTGTGDTSNEASEALEASFETFDQLDETIADAQTTEDKTTAVVELVSVLRQTAGEETPRLKSKTETKPADQSVKDENVTSEKKSFVENMAAVGEELLDISTS